jgi:K(+)-stimulated pyrophosphate-energized sodium pump
MAKFVSKFLGLSAAISGFAASARAGEADITLPDLNIVTFQRLGGLNGSHLMWIGVVICVFGLIYGLVQYARTHELPVHESMRDVSNTIWETCKSYLIQQGKFLAILWVLIAACIVYYFGYLEHKGGEAVALIVRRDV